MATKKTTDSSVSISDVEALPDYADTPRGELRSAIVMAATHDGRVFVHPIRWTSRSHLKDFVPKVAAAGVIDAARWVEVQPAPAALRRLITLDGEAIEGVGSPAEQSAVSADFTGAPEVEGIRTRCPDLQTVALQGRVVGYRLR